MIEKGTKFGRLTVIRQVTGVTPNKQYECVCECGSLSYSWDTNLRQGRAKSCGCLEKELKTARKTTHGHTVHGHTANSGKYMSKTYTSWLKMKSMCNNPNEKAYKEWLTYPEKWDKFEGFLEDMGEKPENTTFYRLDVLKHFSKENCVYCEVGEITKLR